MVCVLRTETIMMLHRTTYLYIRTFSINDPNTLKSTILGRFTELKIILSSSLGTKYRLWIILILNVYNKPRTDRYKSRKGGLPHPAL